MTVLRFRDGAQSELLGLYFPLKFRSFSVCGTCNICDNNAIFIQQFTYVVHRGSLWYPVSIFFFFFLLAAPTVLMIYDRNFLELVQWQERSWLVYINPSDLCSHVLNYRLMETCCGLLLPIEIRSPPQPGVILIHIQHPGSRSIGIDLQ